MPSSPLFMDTSMKIFLSVTSMLEETLDTKKINSKLYAINNSMRNRNDYGYLKDNHVNTRSRNAQGIVNRNYNSFDPLID